MRIEIVNIDERPNRLKVKDMRVGDIFRVEGFWPLYVKHTDGRIYRFQVEASNEAFNLQNPRPVGGTDQEFDENLEVSRVTTITIEMEDYK